jgi:hypothetical protein
MHPLFIVLATSARPMMSLRFIALPPPGEGTPALGSTAQIGSAKVIQPELSLLSAVLDRDLKELVRAEQNAKAHEIRGL